MHHVLDHVMQRPRELRVAGAVKDLLAFAPGLHEATDLQKLQVVRYRGAAHFHERGDVDDALLGVAQKKKDAAAAGVAQLFEDLRDRLKAVRLGKRCSGLLRRRSVLMRKRAARTLRVFFLGVGLWCVCCIGHGKRKMRRGEKAPRTGRTGRAWRARRGDGERLRE